LKAQQQMALVASMAVAAPTNAVSSVVESPNSGTSPRVALKPSVKTLAPASNENVNVKQPASHLEYVKKLVLKTPWNQNFLILQNVCDCFPVFHHIYPLVRCFFFRIIEQTG